MMGNSSRQQGLTSTRWTVEEHTFRLGNTQSLEELRMLHRQLNNLLDLLDLLVQTTDHFVSAVWHFLDHHQADQWVDFVGQDLVEEIAIVLKGNSCVWCHLGHVDVLVNINDELAFWMDFDEDLFLVHCFDNLANI